MSEQFPSNIDLYRPMIYRIRLRGRLSGQWADWFNGLTITFEENDTLLSGPVADQSALYGLLRKVRDLGMPLLSVTCLETVSIDA